MAGIQTEATRLEFVNNIWELATYRYDRITSLWTRNGALCGTPMEPLWKAIEIQDSVRWKSWGTSSAYLDWVSPHPPPSSVRVVVTATALAQWGSDQVFPVGCGAEVDNGLDSELVVEQDGIIRTHMKSGRQLRSVQISSGSGVIELNQLAEGFGQGASGTLAAAFGGAGGLSVSIDSRDVNISMPHVVYKLKQLNQNVGLEALCYTNTEHDTFVASQLLHQYPQVQRQPVELTYGGSFTNSATWKISPGYAHRNRLVGPSGVFDDAEPTKEDFRFIGSASTLQENGERYEWDGFCSHVLPENNSWTIHDLLLPERKGFLWQVTELGTHNPPSPERLYGTYESCGEHVHNLKLRYTWLDGTVGTATRTVLVVDPQQSVSASAPLNDEKPGEDPEKIPVNLDEQGVDGWMAPGKTHSLGQVGNPDFDYDALSTAFGTMSALLGGAAFFDGIFEIPAAMCAIYGTYIQFLEPGGESDDFNAHDAPSSHTWWILANGSTVLSAPVGFYPANWKWRVYLRPQLAKRWAVYDNYKADGFDLRNTVLESSRHRSVTLRRLFHFKQVAPLPGGGGG